jgi:hypothetical protein
MILPHFLQQMDVVNFPSLLGFESPIGLASLIRLFWYIRKGCAALVRCSPASGRCPFASAPAPVGALAFARVNARPRQRSPSPRPSAPVCVGVHPRVRARQRPSAPAPASGRGEGASAAVFPCASAPAAAGGASASIAYLKAPQDTCLALWSFCSAIIFYCICQ